FSYSCYRHLSLSFLFFSCIPSASLSPFFFFNATPTTEIYTLSLHDALPICSRGQMRCPEHHAVTTTVSRARLWMQGKQKNFGVRSEEHTSELQSLTNLVCRLLLEKKKTCLSVSRICKLIADFNHLYSADRRS